VIRDSEKNGGRPMYRANEADREAWDSASLGDPIRSQSRQPAGYMGSSVCAVAESRFRWAFCDSGSAQNRQITGHLCRVPSGTAIADNPRLAISSVIDEVP
jgi:hypothetical protein